MRAIASLSSGLFFLICAGAAGAQATKATADRNAPLVRELAALYDESMQAARRGDLDSYWRFRTAASRTRPPALDSARLQLLAGLLPPLDSLDFVRLDNSGKVARALYRWRKQDVAQYSVIVYRQEQGQWRIDDVSVRRDGNAAPAGAPVPPTSARPATSPPQSATPVPQSPTPAARSATPATQPAPTAGLDHRAQELLKAWESGNTDASRSLSAPRL